MSNVNEKVKGKGDWVEIPGEFDSDYKGKPKTGKRRVIPQRVLREIAHSRTDGGTAMCWKCRTWFAMYYMRRVKVGSFQIELVCCDCVKSNGYVKID